MAGSLGRNTLLIGQCIAHNTKNAAKVRYFPTQKSYFIHDPEEQCKVGDVVLIKELPEKMTKLISHSLVKMVYKFGDIGYKKWHEFEPGHPLHDDPVAS
ncbi:28S ribosomal protein S17-like [Homarus americanus]|uniref:28S ribosomal protein S17-like n=1 Tax=Homarus americanus TaxID=6706 RepID=A0A8J5JZ81_HOMAM|nr:28S ribosomal protein S17-like [Homarus americanus]